MLPSSARTIDGTSSPSTFAWDHDLEVEDGATPGWDRRHLSVPERSAAVRTPVE
jgi:hypothetical protein